MQKIITATVVVAFLLGGCSSRPREFNPILSAAPAEQSRFDTAYAECKQLFVTGKLDSSGRLASGGAGVAAGAVATAGGAAAATGAGLYTGAAIASATVVLIPFVALGGAWGMAKAKQKRKERAIQTAMNGCLRERGFAVQGWERAPRGERTAAATDEPRGDR